MYKINLVAQKMRDAAFDRKKELEREDYKSVSFSVGQTYTFDEVNNNFDDDFWNGLKTELYGLDISISTKDNLCFSFYKL